MEKDNFQSAVAAYNEALDKIIASGDNWYSFLKTIGINSRLPRAAQVIIWDKNPEAHYNMREKQWNKAGYGCDKEHALVIPSGRTTAELYSSDAVYPLDSTAPVPVWFFDDDLTKEVLSSVASQFGVAINATDDISSAVSVYVESLDTPSNNENNLFALSLSDILLSRLGKPTTAVYGYSYDVSHIDRASAEKLIDRLIVSVRPFLELVQDISIKNQKCVNYTFDRGTVSLYNEVENKQQEEPFDEEHLGQNNDGPGFRLRERDATSGHQERIPTDSGNGVLGNETVAVGGAGRRLSSQVLEDDVEQPALQRPAKADRPSASGTGTRTSSDERLQRALGANVRASVGTGAADTNPRKDTRITGNRLVEICARKIQRHQPGGGNSGAGDSLQLNLFENEYNTNETARLDENDPAVFYYENVERQILSGSGFANGKYRIYKYFTENTGKKEREKFLKSEYGVGGSTFTFSDGTYGWAQHDGKGLSYEHSDSGTKIFLTYSDVAYIIDSLIQADLYLSEKEKAGYEPYWEKERDRDQRRGYVRRVFDLHNKSMDFNDELPQSVNKCFSKVRDASNTLITDGYDAVLYRDSVSVGQHLFNYLSECQTVPELRDEAERLLEELRVIQPDLFERDTVADYFQLKEEYADAILLFPVGDFYEAMGDDATVLVKELGLIELSRDDKSGKRVPMAGIPANQLETGTDTLVHKGYTVAVATVTEDNVPDKTYTIVPAQDKPIVVSDNVETMTPDEVLEATVPEVQNSVMLNLHAFEEELPSSAQRINTPTHRNFRTLVALVPALLNKKITYIRLEAGEGMMPLVIERNGGNRISITHYYEQMGDLMADPDMSFLFDIGKQELRPRTYQQDSMSVYQDVQKEDGSVNFLLENELSRFTSSWFKNIGEQEYRVNRLMFDYNGTDVQVSFDADGNAYLITPDEEGKQFCDEFNYILAEPPKADEERYEFEDVDADEVRRELADSGIVDGRVVDETKLNNNEFVQQVTNDVAALSENDAVITADEAEIDVVCDLLLACKIDDMVVEFDGDTIVASDNDGNKWKGAELYQFLLNEVLTFGTDGKLVEGLSVDERIINNVLAYAKKYGVEPELVDDGIAPIWKSYTQLESQFPDVILFLRVGDFYEVMGESAKVVSTELDLVLTGRDCGLEDRVPMCGVPAHSIDSYISQLVVKGHRVAVAESQDVNRIVVPGKEQHDETELAQIEKETDVTIGNYTVHFGYDSPGEDTKWAIVNNVTQEYYTDTDNLIHAFDTKSEAISYLESLGLDKAPTLAERVYRVLEQSDKADMVQSISEAKTPEQAISAVQKELSTPDGCSRMASLLTDITTEHHIDMREAAVMDGVAPSEADISQLRASQQLVADVFSHKEELQRAGKNDTPTIITDNYRIMNDDIGVGTPNERYMANVEAVKTLKLIEREGRSATSAEQSILAQYVGWGGLSEAFDERSSHYRELRSLLNEQEYAAARSSTLTAFYTPPVVIRSIYTVLQNMGFDGGEVLEPSCGTGNFFGMLPDDLANKVNLTGVELDSISGRIAKQLYPQADIHIKGFEETDFREEQFDVAIGNVPFGQFSVSDREYDKFHFLIHDYFFAKTLDKVRSGGVIAFVTSKGTMDKATPTVRKYIARRAELIGAVRLPNNAFKRAAGTEVTTDIIFLKKRENTLDIEPDWVHLDKDANGIEMNSYYVQHPEMVLGQMQRVSTAYGYDTACLDNGRDLSEQLAFAIRNITGTIGVSRQRSVQEDDTASIPARDGVRDGAFDIVEGKVYRRNGSVMEYDEKAQKKIERVRGLIAVREQVYSLINIQLDGTTDEVVALHQERLLSVYNDFVEKFGRIDNQANNVFKDDPSHPLLCGLEHYNSDKEFIGLSDMFTKRTVRPNRVITYAKSSSDALMASLNVRGKVDVDYMMALTGFSKETVVNDLTNIIYRVPNMDATASEVYVTADEYLSGNVRQKLEFARIYKSIKQEAWIDVNISALESVQPEPLHASQIQVRLGATWVPTDIVDEFMYNLFNTNVRNRDYVKTEYSDLTGVWAINNKGWEAWSVAAKTTYGTGRANGYDLLEDALNLRDTVVRDRVTENGKDKYVVNEQETRLAQGKQKLIRQAFTDWIWRDPERRKRLETLYNQKFNSTVQRKYDGSHLQFDGMNCNITLRPHQKDAIARCLYGRNALLAHCVGAGKTFEMCAAAMEGKRVGLWHKSLIAVPKNIVSQFATEFMELYPAANILVASEKDFSKENRRRFCARAATGDYDAIVMSYSQFERIPLSLVTEERMLQAQKDEIEAGITSSRREGQHITVKQLQATLKRVETRLKALQESEQDDVVTFEELGVDKLFVDEAHNFKNLFLYTKMSGVAGISTTDAKKSTDMFNKVRWLDEQTGGRGTVFATGTPISNSMTELYTMQRYLMYDELKAAGISHFDAWVSSFCETTTELELKPEGTGFRLKKRLSKFNNLPELMTLFRRAADIITADMIDLPTPEMETINRVVEASDFQKETVQSFVERADSIRAGRVTPDVDNMLKVTNDGRKLALDQRLMDASLPDYPGSKVNDCVDNVFHIWEENADKKSTQIIFCDLSTPNGKGFNVYDDIKTKLIARGVPENEIAYAHDANTDKQKSVLYKKVRSGSVRILLGSTQKLGTGTNVQDRLIAIHNLDAPWRPSDLGQRQGRIERQGNTNKKAYCYNYITEGTFDAYMFQILENKQRFIAQIMNGDASVREYEEVDEVVMNYAQIKALATGNPLIQELMQLDIEVRDLTFQKSNHQRQIFDLQDRIAVDFPKTIQNCRTTIASLENELQVVTAHASEQYIVYNEDVIADPKSIGTVVNSFYDDLVTAKKDQIPFGTFKGLPMTVTLDYFTKKMSVNVGANTQVEMRLDATANGKRVLGSLDALSEKLENAKAHLEDTLNDFEEAKIAVERDFPLQMELDKKQSRLDELNAMFAQESNKVPGREVNKDYTQ